jgi:hypothetical protein
MASSSPMHVAEAAGSGLQWHFEEEDPHVEEGDAVSKLGLSFFWTREHMKGIEFAEWRQTGDEAADNFLSQVLCPPFAHYLLPALRLFGIRVCVSKEGANLFALLLIFVPQASLVRGNDSLDHLKTLASDTSHAGHFAAAQLLDQISTRPKWLVDTQLALGQKMFIRHGVGCLAMVRCLFSFEIAPLTLFHMKLFHYSLVGGFGAPQINKGGLYVFQCVTVLLILFVVLTSTGYLSSKQKNTHRRLHETLQMVTDCLPEGALDIGGQGWASCVRVRLLHAQVRHRLLRMKSWERSASGVPINQEDMVSWRYPSCQFNIHVCIPFLL